MIRMVLIYTALFAVAAGAIWMKPSSNTTDDLAALPEQEFRDLTHLVLTDLGAGGLNEEVTVSRTLATSERPAQRPLRGGFNEELSTQVLQQLEIANGGPAPATTASEDERSLATLISRALTEDATGAELDRIVQANETSVDLAPLLDVPGSIATERGTRFLASALMRQQSQSAGTLSEITDVATLSAPAEPAQEERYYVVRPGDSLGSIARAVYGSSAAYRDIYEANRDNLKSINSIRVGQRLRLP